MSIAVNAHSETLRATQPHQARPGERATTHSGGGDQRSMDKKSDTGRRRSLVS
jgi:hypothetical protein